MPNNPLYKAILRLKDEMADSFVLTAFKVAYHTQAIPDFSTVSPRIPYIFHASLTEACAIFLSLTPRKQYLFLRRMQQGSYNIQ